MKASRVTGSHVWESQQLTAQTPTRITSQSHWEGKVGDAKPKAPKDTIY